MLHTSLLTARTPYEILGSRRMIAGIERVTVFTLNKDSDQITTIDAIPQRTANVRIIFGRIFTEYHHTFD